MRVWNGALIGGLAIGLACAAATPATAQSKIYAGPRTGIYYTAFGPLLRDFLGRAFFKYEIAETLGGADTVTKLAADPGAIALVQTDVLAAEMATKADLAKRLTVIRNDVALECLFAAVAPASADRLKTWGEVQSYARRLRIVTGPQTSAAASSLRFLQTLDAPLASAKFTYLASADAAIAEVAKGAADVAFFVELPDSTSPRFKAINDSKLVFLPVIDRAMLRATVSGDKPVYVAEEVGIGNVAGGPGWLGGSKITTACTPIAYATGNPEALPARSPQQLDAKEVVDKVRTADVAALRPKESWFKTMYESAVQASGLGLDGLLERVDRAARELRQ
ncbi:MAG: hypothetical protein GC191_01770 [Azospirillum sp.]|nr:hypothetical protein [Azospirillum sp.]